MKARTTCTRDPLSVCCTGSNHLYVFKNPLHPSTESLPDSITWEFAQKEIAEVKGFSTGMQDMSKGQSPACRT